MGRVPGLGAPPAGPAEPQALDGDGPADQARRREAPAVLHRHSRPIAAARRTKESRTMFKYKRPLAVAIAAASLLTSAAASADDAALVTQIVDTFYKIYGTHPGFRVNHAKGVVAEGSFVATPAASALSRAALFDGSSIPVTVRFSNDGGLPSVPDGAPSNPKGMAIKFHMPGVAEVDIVLLAVKFFPVASGEEFRDLLVAISESPADAPKPTKLDQFAAGDPTSDPSEPWPDNRQVVDLGVLTLDKPVADSLEAQKKLAFLPTHLTDGIELSDDGLLVIRAGAEALSFARRGR